MIASFFLQSCTPEYVSIQNILCLTLPDQNNNYKLKDNESITQSPDTDILNITLYPADEWNGWKKSNRKL